MKRWCIAVVLIAALLCVGAVGAVKPDKGPVDELVFVHYDDATTGASSIAEAQAMYELWGMKWSIQSLPVIYNVYTSNKYVPNSDLVLAQFQEAFNAWDASTSAGLFKFGSRMTQAPKRLAANGKNDIYFTAIGEPNVIAKTTVWYYENSMEIVEADVQMNSRMRWGVDTDGEGTGYTLRNAYDIRNIATHEIGHVCGLSDLYETGASALTMYGYGSIGEVKKISLEQDDIDGVRVLYGA